MINLCNILLPAYKPHAVPADIGKIFKPIPVFDKVIKVDVALVITIQSTDSNIVFGGLYYLYFFFDLLFLSLR